VRVHLPELVSTQHFFRYFSHVYLIHSMQATDLIFGGAHLLELTYAINSSRHLLESPASELAVYLEPSFHH
jgi:hypothetical protein